MFPSAVFPRYLCLFACVAGCALPVAAATHGHVIDSYGKLPLQFEANQGQSDKAVHFLSRESGYSLYLTASEAVHTGRSRSPVPPTRAVPTSRSMHLT